jgi:CO/xanthine dehydrogenase Mo-binding subunit
VDDLAPPNRAHAVVVRSPHAHTRIVSIDKARAEASPGVLAVLTGTDYLADGLGPIPHAAGLMVPPDLVVRQVSLGPIITDHYPTPPEWRSGLAAMRWDRNSRNSSCMIHYY